MQILVIEDDRTIGKSLRQGFEEARHECTWITSGRKGFELASSQRFDVLVVDLMLPDLGGLEILRSLRAAGVQTPALVLTALGTVDERVEGLRAGADDYLVKPFAFAELLARLEALRRRSTTRPGSIVEVGDLSLDLATRRATAGGKAVDLTPTEFSLLEFLMRHAGQVVTRRMLCEHLWATDWEGQTNVIEVHVNRLRRKLDRGREQSLIETVRGRGYAIRAV